MLLRIFVVFVAIGLSTSGYGETNLVISPDKKVLAYTVGRGESRVLATEIWTMYTDGTGARQVGTFLGEPGYLSFLPDGKGLVYIERSFSYPAFRLYLNDEQDDLPILRNRIWILKTDGSDESLWPLPEDVQPLEIAVSSTGEMLVAIGYRGNPLYERDWGLWVVDRRGNAVRLLSGRMTGPLNWSSDLRRISCFVEDRKKPGQVSIHLNEEKVTVLEVIEVGTGEWSDSTQVVDAELASMVSRFDSNETLNPSRYRDMQNVLNLIHRAVDLYMKGHYAMHKGNYRATKKAYKKAIRAFEAIYKRYPESGISKVDCLGYIRALRNRVDMKERAYDQVICQEHMLVLGNLIERYTRTHAKYFPPDLAKVFSWGKYKVEEKDPEVLTRILYCPADPNSDRSSSYIYQPKASPGSPVLTCFWHPGKVLRLVVAPGRYGIEESDFSSDLTDSLNVAAAHHLETGETTRAVSLLEAVAHQHPKNVNAHIKLGHACLKINDAIRAEQSFKKAISLGRDKAIAEAFYGLGLIYMKHSRKGSREMRFSRAIDYFRDALILDQDHIEARFQRAKARYLLKDYNSKVDMENVLKRDPNYADVYLLMGDWYTYFVDEYKQAIDWYMKYLMLRPNDSEAWRRLGFAFLKIKEYDKILEVLLTFAQENPEAFELMPIVAQACVKQEQLDLALYLYQTYISKIDSKERALYEDISLISSKEKLAEYEGTSGEERKAFLKRFWNKRDPNLTTLANERLLEHYRRVWHARAEFSKGKQPWDVRGEVYIRFGEPDHRTSSQVMNASQSLEVQRVKERIALDIYDRGAMGLDRGPGGIGVPEPVRAGVAEEDSLSFPEMGLGQASEGLDYTRDVTEETFIGPVFPVRSLPLGDRYYWRDEGLGASSDAYAFLFGEYGPVTISGGDISAVPWESWVYTRIGGGIEITFTDEVHNGVYDFAPVPMSSEISPAQLAKFVRYAPGAVFEREAAATPNYYIPEYNVEPFDFYFDLADFRGSGGRSVLEVYYGIPNASATRYIDEKDVTRLIVNHHVALIPTSADTVYRIGGELIYRETGDRRGSGIFVPDVVRLEVPPGTYRLQVGARDRLTGRLGLYQKETEVETYGGEGLKMSDLELAWNISEETAVNRFSKGRLHVIPMPTRIYCKGQSVFVYFEVYNLVKNEFGQTKYQVEYMIGSKKRGILSQFVRTFGEKKKEVGVRYEQAGLGETEVVYMELDLEDSSPGRYYLKVKVIDLNSGETTTKVNFFKMTH